MGCTCECHDDGCPVVENNDLELAELRGRYDDLHKDAVMMANFIMSLGRQSKTGDDDVYAAAWLLCDLRRVAK